MTIRNCYNEALGYLRKKSNNPTSPVYEHDFKQYSDEHCLFLLMKQSVVSMIAKQELYNKCLQLNIIEG